MDAAMPCKKKTKHTSSLLETAERLEASNEVTKTKYACIVESRESTRQRVDHLYQNLTKTSLQSRDSTRWIITIWFSHAAGCKGPECEGRSGKGIEQALNNLSVAAAWGQEPKQKRKLSNKHKKSQEGPLCYIDRRMSSQEFWVRTTIPKSTR